MSTIKRYFRNILTALSQLLNAVLGGDPDETVSGRSAKNLHRSGWRMLANILDFIDPGHTQRAREDDEGKDQSLNL